MGEALNGAVGLSLKIRGVRGSVPTPRASHLEFGGNTPSLELRGPNGELVVLDAGTGIRSLGLELVERDPERDHIDIFFTHFHWDHIQGLPFFRPLYNENFSANFHSVRQADSDLQRILQKQMSSPFFPLSFGSLPARKTFEPISTGVVDIGELTIRAFPLTHPQGAHGYRVECNGAVLVYATDHEHGQEAVDAGLVDHCDGADLLIYDAHYTPEEYLGRVGWGHSTWLEAVRLAERAGVKRLILFHHAPEHNDVRMHEIEETARKSFENIGAAREGSEFRF